MSSQPSEGGPGDDVVSEFGTSLTDVGLQYDSMDEAMGDVDPRRRGGGGGLDAGGFVMPAVPKKTAAAKKTGGAKKAAAKGLSKAPPPVAPAKRRGDQLTAAPKVRRGSVTSVTSNQCDARACCLLM